MSERADAWRYHFYARRYADEASAKTAFEEALARERQKGGNRSVNIGRAKLPDGTTNFVYALGMDVTAETLAGGEAWDAPQWVVQSIMLRRLRLLADPEWVEKTKGGGSRVRHPAKGMRVGPLGEDQGIEGED